MRGHTTHCFCCVAPWHFIPWTEWCSVLAQARVCVAYWGRSTGKKKSHRWFFELLQLSCIQILEGLLDPSVFPYLFQSVVGCYGEAPGRSIHSAPICKAVRGQSTLGNALPPGCQHSLLHNQSMLGLGEGDKPALTVRSCHSASA